MVERRESSYWRQVQQNGVTGQFRANQVAELSNPGPVFEFHGQLYKKKDRQLVLCTPEEVRKVRMLNHLKL